MKIEEYLGTLPQNIISGEDVQLPEKSLRDIFDFVNLNENDIFYHLGCGNGNGVNLAITKYNVKKAVGIDKDQEKIKMAEKNFQNKNSEFICQNIIESDISEASVILFWFTEEKIINEMMKKFENLKEGVKIITIWAPLPLCIPQKVKFPYILNTIPLERANDLSEQLLSIFKVKCIDFITAWEYAERYTKAIQEEKSENDRFLTIIQTLVIWINARNLGVSCEQEIPESISTYIGIMKNFYNLDFGHLLK